MESSPLQKANEFAHNAEELAQKGDFANACTLHFRAAEQFLLAMNDTKDAEVYIHNQAVKTLKLLYASHTRAGKELQRKVNSPPSRRPTAQRSERRILEPLEARQKAVHLYSNRSSNPKETKLDDNLGSRQFFVGQQVTDSAIMNNSIKYNTNRFYY